MRLDHFGRRICIMGPSNSGKSTLATAIGRSRGLAVVHLDRLRHYPNTDWQLRPNEEFVALHDDVIEGDDWVMDGNYSGCLPQRLTRATGFILLDASTVRSVVRYLYRSSRNNGRVGALDGGRDSVKWSMLHHIMVATRENRLRYDEIFHRIALPKIRLGTPREAARFYRLEALDRYHGSTP